MPEQNKTVLRRMLNEVISGGNLDLIDELVAPDFVNHAQRRSGEIMKMVGIDAFRAAQAQMQAAFSNLWIEEQQMVAEDDKVVVHYRFSGIHTGTFRDIPATGKSVTVSGISIVRFVNGKFVERWGIMDTYAMLKQLGVVSRT